MKLIYAQGFTATEREDCRSTIFSNLVNAFRTIFKAMDELDIGFGNTDNGVRKCCVHPSFGVPTERHRLRCVHPPDG